MKILSLRVPEDLVGELDDLNDALGSVIPFNRSKVLRELISQNSLLWLHSPYVATSAHALVYVGGNGDMYLRVTQELFLRESQHKLPTRISMKPEKEREFEERTETAGEAAERIRDKWIINYFAAGNGNQSQPLDEKVDRLGITSKSCELEINMAQDSVIRREILVGIKDYVQRDSPEDVSDARASVSVHIPTLHLTAAVLVDLDLYQGTTGKRHTAQVDFEMRNAEDAVLRTKDYKSEVNSTKWQFGRHPGVSRRQVEPRNECLAMFRQFQRRIRVLRTKRIRGRAIVEHEKHREKLLFKQPKEFLFGLFTWPMPPVGLKVCLTWNKPDPVE